jgi:hypothetical protein
MSPLRCAYTYLLDHVDATLNFLLSFSPCEFPTQRQTYKHALCTAIFAALSPHDIFAYLSDGPYPDSARVRANMGRADPVGMLAAAAAVDCEPAMRFLIEKVPGVAACSELYGAPLLAAAVNGHARAAEFLFLYMAEDERVAKQLAHTIETCMEKQCDALLPLLISWWLHLPLPKTKILRNEQRKLLGKNKDRWLEWGAKKGNLEIVNLCWTPPEHYYKGTCTLTHSAFKLACKNGHAQIIQRFILLADPEGHGGHACPSSGKYKHVHAFCFLTRGLWDAASNGWVGLARFLIEAGADVNGGSDECGAKVGPALHLALCGGHLEMVRLLLGYGAKVDRGILMLAVLKGGEVGRIVAEAGGLNQAWGEGCVK